MKNRAKYIAMQVVTAILLLAAILANAEMSYSSKNDSELTNVVSDINQ